MLVPYAPVIATAVLIVTIFGLRYLLLKAIKRQSEILSYDQKRWISRVKNTAIIIIIFGIVTIWAPQLQALALSLTAVAVALVVATKEMILCLMGALMRVTAVPFRVGDWITIDNVTGEVIDINAWNFYVQEVETAHQSYQFTGKTIEVPNSKLFTSNIENLNFVKNYIFLEIPITVPNNDINPDEFLEKVRRVAEEYYTPLAGPAKTYNRKIEKKSGIDIPDPEPVIFISSLDSGHTKYTVRMFVPTVKNVEIHGAIKQRLLKYVYDAKNPDKAAAKTAKK